MNPAERWGWDGAQRLHNAATVDVAAVEVQGFQGGAMPWSQGECKLVCGPTGSLQRQPCCWPATHRFHVLPCRRNQWYWWRRGSRPCRCANRALPAGLLLQFCLMCFAWVVSSIPRYYCTALHSQAYDCTGQPTPSHSATCSAAWSMRKLLCMCRGVNISCLRKLRKRHRRGPAGGR